MQIDKNRNLRLFRLMIFKRIPSRLKMIKLKEKQLSLIPTIFLRRKSNKKEIIHTQEELRILKWKATWLVNWIIQNFPKIKADSIRALLSHKKRLFYKADSLCKITLWFQMNIIWIVVNVIIRLMKDIQMLWKQIISLFQNSIIIFHWIVEIVKIFTNKIKSIEIPNASQVDLLSDNRCRLR